MVSLGSDVKRKLAPSPPQLIPIRPSCCRTHHTTAHSRRRGRDQPVFRCSQEECGCCHRRPGPSSRSRLPSPSRRRWGARNSLQPRAYRRPVQCRPLRAQFHLQFSYFCSPVRGCCPLGRRRRGKEGPPPKRLTTRRSEGSWTARDPTMRTWSADHRLYRWRPSAA